jgi:hypothetical protein
MDRELQTYYENRFDLMSKPGWKDLMEDIKVMKEAYSSVESVKTTEELWFKKGQLDILVWLLGLKQASEEAFEDLQNGN